jgi:hypothetical protein
MFPDAIDFLNVSYSYWNALIAEALTAALGWNVREVGLRSSR